MFHDLPLLNFIIITGLLDSINPCAIAVLLIFIALMFTLRKSRGTIMMMGMIYIFSVYLSYFGIGMGILKVFNIFNVPHILPKIMAYVVMFVGLWGLKEEYFPGKFNILTIPLNARQLIAKWANKATFPAAAVAGLLVGITEFPCSGAIYLAAISLLSSKETYSTGLIYLLVYNFMFVLPLIVIFLVATNRLVVEKMINLDEANSGKMRITASIIMLALGVLMLFLA